MLLKNKTFIALTVKLLLAVTVLHAQTTPDSSKQLKPNFLASVNKTFFVNQLPMQSSLPGNYYAKQLPFFCSKELKMEKAVGMPLKFRLGTVEYCDKLEGKNR